MTWSSGAAVMRVAGITVLQYRRPQDRRDTSARILGGAHLRPFEEVFMKRHIACVLALATMAASTAADAQVGGLLRKKAGEVLGKKPEPAKPAPPAPAPAPATETAPATPAPTLATPAPAPAASGSREAAPAAPKKAVDRPRYQRVAVTGSRPIRFSASASIPRANGDWDQLPYIPGAATAAAYAPQRLGAGDAGRDGRLRAEEPRDVGGVPGRSRRLRQERAPGRRPRPQGRGHPRRGHEEAGPQADGSDPGSHDGRDGRGSGEDRCPATP